MCVFFFLGTDSSIRWPLRNLVLKPWNWLAPSLLEGHPAYVELDLLDVSH